jgi:hypothetical protein
MALSRRSFLGLSAAGTLVLGAAGLALFPGKRVPPQDWLLTFTESEYSTLVALIETVSPGSSGVPSGVELGVAAELDTLFSTLPPENGAEIALALGLIENALVGAILDARPRPFSRLPLERRAEIWAAWCTSRIPLRRTVYKGLNALILATTWGHPEMTALAGYSGPPSVPPYGSDP